MSTSIYVAEFNFIWSILKKEMVDLQKEFSSSCLGIIENSRVCLMIASNNTISTTHAELHSKPTILINFLQMVG